MRHTTLIILAAAIWGMSGLFVKASLLPIISLTFLRCIVPTIVAGSTLTKEQLLFYKHPKFILISTLSFIRLTLQLFAFKLSSAIGLVLVAIYLWPVFHYLTLLFFKKTQVSAINILCFILSLSGIIIGCSGFIQQPSPTDILAISLATLSAIILGINLYFIKEYCATISTMHTLYVHNVVGSICLFPACFLILSSPLSDIVFGLCFGLTIGFVSFWLWFHSVKALPSSYASMFSYIEMPSGMLLGFFLLNETLTPHLIIGSGLIVCSAVIVTVASNPPQFLKRKLKFRPIS